MSTASLPGALMVGALTAARAAFAASSGTDSSAISSAVSSVTMLRRFIALSFMSPPRQAGGLPAHAVCTAATLASRSTRRRQ